MRTAGRSLFRECANGSPKLHPSVLIETGASVPPSQSFSNDPVGGGLLCYIPPSLLSPLLAHRVEMGMSAIALLIGAKRTCAVEGPDSTWRGLATRRRRLRDLPAFKAPSMLASIGGRGT
jgi:hypothetical protein